MTRLVGIFLDVLALPCALLFVTTVVLWVRSYVTPDVVGRSQSWVIQKGHSEWESHLSYLWIVSSDGRLMASKTDQVLAFDGPTLPLRWTWSHQVPPAPEHPRTFWSRFGLIVSRIEKGERVALGRWNHWDVRVVGTPYWLPAALLGGCCWVCIRGMRRRHRTRSAGLCAACGYDLRATPDRCPECGAVPSNAIAGKTKAAP